MRDALLLPASVTNQRQVDMLVTKKIRLEVSEQDAEALEWMQGKCRGLYNWWVMKLREGERWPGWAEAKKTLQASRAYDPELNGVYGKLLAEVYFRLDNAMQAFFRRVKNGETPGFPPCASPALLFHADLSSHVSQD